MGTLVKLTVDEYYLSEQIFNMDKTFLFWKWMPGRTFIHKQAKSMPGFSVCVSKFYGVRLTARFSERIPVVKRRMTVHKITIFPVF